MDDNGYRKFPSAILEVVKVKASELIILSCTINVYSINLNIFCMLRNLAIMAVKE